MSKYEAQQDLVNAKQNANNVITYAERLKAKDADLALAVQSIGYSLHAIARALENTVAK